MIKVGRYKHVNGYSLTIFSRSNTSNIKDIVIEQWYFNIKIRSIINFESTKIEIKENLNLPKWLEKKLLNIHFNTCNILKDKFRIQFNKHYITFTKELEYDFIQITDHRSNIEIIRSFNREKKEFMKELKIMSDIEIEKLCL
jgi:hypothetical protein